MHHIKEILKFLDGMSKILRIVTAIIMGIIGFIVSYEVIMRYVFNNPTGWTLAFVPYLILWGTFLGGAVTLREERHIRVDLVTRHLSQRNEKYLYLFTESIAMVFCIVLFVKGIEMVAQTKQLGIVDASSLRIPLFVPQLCIPIGALLLLIEFIRRMVMRVVSLKDCKVSGKGEAIS